MYRRFHDRFGTAGVIIGVIALVVALAGTAFAAAGLTSKQKKEVTKIAKKYAGKTGAPGAAGTPGTNGKDGANGTNGTNGKDGAPGAPGADGKSVALKNAAPASCGTAGGFTYEIEGSGEENEVCNGSAAAETLEHEEEITGFWSVSSTTAPAGNAVETYANLYFSKLVGAPFGLQSHYIPFGEPPTTECPGEFENPQAVATGPYAGNKTLCIYGSPESTVSGYLSMPVVREDGVVVGWHVAAGTTVSGFGTWAAARG